MILSINYKDGEQRVTNLHPFFFIESKAGLTLHKIAKGDADVSVPERCLSIAMGFNSKPYKIVCIKNGIEIYSRTWEAHKPEEVTPAIKPTTEEKKKKKLLRREFKNHKFTQKWDFTTGLFTNLLTGERMYSDNKIAA